MKIISTVAILALVLSAGAQQEKTAEKQDQQHHDVNERGDHVMGFAHDKTTHHFRLFEDGGAIEVAANDAKDAASRDQIRMHLGHIAGMFATGNFRAPMLVHAVNPPGTATMKQLHSEIEYKFENIERGGRVRITTHNAGALKAVHEFLQFQIKEHHTGDSLEVSKVAP